MAILNHKKEIYGSWWMQKNPEKSNSNAGHFHVFKSTEMSLYSHRTSICKRSICTVVRFLPDLPFIHPAFTARLPFLT